MALNGYQKTMEVYVTTLTCISTTKGLKTFGTEVCNFWCNRGNFCSPSRCPFGRAYAKREKEVQLLEEANETLRQRAKINMRERIVSTKHRKETKDCFSALKRSCTCALKRETDPVIIKALTKISANIKRGNKAMIKYYAEKHNIECILKILGKKEVVDV